jgi:hypothetical protein
LKNRLLLISAGLTIAAVSLAAARAGAAPNPARPAGVTLSPAFQQVSIGQDESEHPVSFRITNDQSTAQTYDLAAADFNTLGESGGLFFVGTNPTQLQKKYGLAKWFSLPDTSVTVQPNQTITLTAQIQNLPDLAPGGHYGALMLSQTSDTGGAGANKVSLHPVASSLLFVTKLGGDTHSLQLTKVTADRNLFKLPGAVTLRFYNDGNTHVVPRGVVKLSTPGGRLISQGVINENSNIILPQSHRQIYVPLSKFSGASAVSKYVLTVDFRFDGFDGYREYKTSFWRIDPGLVAGLAIIAGSAAVLIYKRLKHRP